MIGDCDVPEIASGELATILVTVPDERPTQDRTPLPSETKTSPFWPAVLGNVSV